MAQVRAGRPGRIFISYRREDTAYPAGWLYDRLSDEFGGAQLFKDVDNLKPGDDFVEKITSAVSSCDVLLALIGPEWATIADHRGRRLDDPGDFVRLEIEVALKRRVRVIPLLVGGARMPSVEELPPGMTSLARRQALELTPGHFNRDAEELVEVLDDALVSAGVETGKIPRYGASAVADPAAEVDTDHSTPDPPDTSPDPPDTSLTGSIDHSVLPQPEQTRDEPPEIGVTPMPPETVTPPHASRRRYAWLAAAVVAGGITATLIAVGILQAGNGGDSSPTASAEADPTPTASLQGLPKSATPLRDDLLLWRWTHDGLQRVRVLNSRGGIGRRLTNSDDERAAVITHDRRTVLYVRDPVGGPRSLHAVSADGKKDQLLFSLGADVCPRLGRPALSADGVLVMACKGLPNDEAALTVVSLDGKVLRTLDRGKLDDPTFCEGGTTVVYWRNPPEATEDGGALYRVDTDGRSEPSRLTNGEPGQDADPACSPDGDQVAFSHADGDRRWIGRIRVGADVQDRPDQLTFGADEDKAPSWSPDGSQLAFRRGPVRDSDLWIADLDRDRERKLVDNNGGQDADPAWTTR
jgi:hypothetical protein